MARQPHRPAHKTLGEKVRETLGKIIPPTEIDLDKVKGEVWEALAALYYKYEDPSQKRAFREVVKEMCGLIAEGKWEQVYRKMYREEKKNRIT